MFPLGFGEFLDFRGIPYRRRTTLDEMQYDPHEFERLKANYEEFVSYGGLPDIVLEPRVEAKREILNDVFSSYINIDVQSLADFRKIGELQQLLKVLAMRIGNKLDFSKLSNIVGVSRPTLKGYLEFLEKTYIIYQLPAYSSPDKAAALGRKLYFRDNGIAGILANPGEGALFENAIFNQLWGYGGLAYLSRGNEYEVDFILTQSGEPPAGLEVKYHPVQSDEMKLRRIAAKHRISKTWLVGKYPSPGFEEFIWGGTIF